MKVMMRLVVVFPRTNAAPSTEIHDDYYLTSSEKSKPFLLRNKQKS